MATPAPLICGSCRKPAKRLTARRDPKDPKSCVALDHEDCYAQLIDELMIGDTTARAVLSARLAS